MDLDRRQLMQSALVAMAAPGKGGRPPRVLLRSSWQVVNIGDIGHTPGMLALLQRHLPEAEVVVWTSNDFSAEVEAMERRRFPKVRFVKAGPASDEASDWCDFLLHGSGPSLVGMRDVASFAERTGKPYGVYAITYGGADAPQRKLLTAARFVFFRDSVSLEKAKQEGVACPLMELAPDAAFAVDLRNDKAALSFLREHRLAPGKFLCCIPRLRYTPYWKIRNTEMKAEDHRRHARNEEMKEHDHAPLREAITAVVRQTGIKVLVCPEDASHMAVGKEMLVDRLPDDVRKRVVWRPNFWLTDEAVSTYVQSAGLFGMEMHSPIMCVGQGIPAIVGRFSEQTSKGFMWRDIGLDDWLFDLDDPEKMARFTKTVLGLVTDRAGAKHKVNRARALVEKRQRETLAVLRRHLHEGAAAAATSL